MHDTKGKNHKGKDSCININVIFNFYVFININKYAKTHTYKVFVIQDKTMWIFITAKN